MGRAETSILYFNVSVFAGPYWTVHFVASTDCAQQIIIVKLLHCLALSYIALP